jgi:hypothetical protein
MSDQLPLDFSSRVAAEDSPPPITLAKVKELIGRTWFDFEETETEITLDTRDSGDVGEETPGAEDIAEARRIMKAIRTVFPKETHLTDWETCDEWVSVTIKKQPRPMEEIRKDRLIAEFNAKFDAVKERIAEKFSLGLRSVSVYWRNDELDLNIVFGDQILYLSYHKQFDFRTEDDAETAAQEIMGMLNALPVESWGKREVSRPIKDFTGNYRPPNNVISIKQTLTYRGRLNLSW